MTEPTIELRIVDLLDRLIQRVEEIEIQMQRFHDETRMVDLKVIDLLDRLIEHAKALDSRS